MVHAVIANADKRLLVESASRAFGGCTAIETEGGWLDPETNKLLVETGVQVSIGFAEYSAVAAWASDYGYSIGERFVFVYDNTREESIPCAPLS